MTLFPSDLIRVRLQREEADTSIRIGIFSHSRLQLATYVEAVSIEIMGFSVSKREANFTMEAMTDALRQLAAPLTTSGRPDRSTHM